MVDRVKFEQRVDAYEQLRNDNPKKFHRLVVGFTLLALAWVWGGLLVGVALIAWAPLYAVQYGFQWWQVFAFLGGVAVLLGVQRLTRSDWSKPHGIAVPQAECARLFEALERIRQKTSGPRIHHLIITEDYGLQILQQTRLSGLLPARNYLLLGLPLAMAIDRPRLIAMLAQEYSHLRQRPQWFLAGVYRARRRLQGLYNRLADSRQMVRIGWLNERFTRWLLPRWWAASFVEARQDELLADSMAAKLVTMQLMGDSLSEVAVRGRWLREQFWQMHWARARDIPQPIGPFSLMEGVLNHSMDVNWVYQAWKQEYQALSGYSDTRPGLRERLDALQIPSGLTPVSSSNSLAWLGKRSARWIELLDDRWCRRFAHDWTAHRAVMQLVHSRVEALMPRAPYLQADHVVELGWYIKASEYRDDPLLFYQSALEESPHHVRALAGMACLPMDMDLEAKLPYLEQAFDAIPVMRSQWAAKARGVLDVVEADEHHEVAIRRWRMEWHKRETQALAQERQIYEDRLTNGWLHRAKSYAELPDPLWQSELDIIKLYLAQAKHFRRAWLLARPIEAVDGAFALVLVLDRPGLGYQENIVLQQQLHGYLVQELLACTLMPMWITNLDDLAPKSATQLEAIPAALVYERPIAASVAPVAASR